MLVAFVGIAIEGCSAYPLAVTDIPLSVHLKAAASVYTLADRWEAALEKTCFPEWRDPAGCQSARNHPGFESSPDEAEREPKPTCKPVEKVVCCVEAAPGRIRF